MTQRNKNFDVNTDSVSTDFSVLVMSFIPAAITFRVWCSRAHNLNIPIPAYVTNIKYSNFWLRHLLWNEGLSRLLKSGFDAEMHKQQNAILKKNDPERDSEVHVSAVVEELWHPGQDYNLISCVLCLGDWAGCKCMLTQVSRAIAPSARVPWAACVLFLGEAIFG